MDELEYDLAFLKTQSEDDYNPVLEIGDIPFTLFDKITDYTKHSGYYYHNLVSYTLYDYKLKQFVKHTYAVRRHTKKREFTDEIDIMEVRRDFETYPTIIRNMYYVEYGMQKGTHIIWENKNTYYDMFERSAEWYVLDNNYYKKLGNTLYELNSIENIIASDDSLKYFGFELLNFNVSLLEYIKIYRKEPIVETFMKLGLYRFIENEKAIKTTKENKAFRKWLYRNYTECKGRAFQTVYNSFKKNPNNSVISYYNSLTYRIECGKALASTNKKVYDYALKFATQEKMKAYIEDNQINAGSYMDYLNACKWLKLNFEDTKVMFPKDFQPLHDDYTRQYNDWKQEEDKKQAELKGKKINFRMKQTASKFEFCNFSDDLYTVYVAQSKMELIEEGSKLEHCVGKCDYDERQASGKSLVCFVRNNNALTTPYVTVELRLSDYRVMQAYGIRDSKPNEETLNFINSIWLPFVKRTAKKQFKEI